MRASLLFLLLVVTSLLHGCFGGHSQTTPEAPPKPPLQITTTMNTPPAMWQGKKYWPIVFTKDNTYAHLRWLFLNKAEHMLQLLQLEKAPSLERAQIVVFLEYGTSENANTAVLQGTQNLPQLQERLRGGKSIPPYAPRPLQGYFPALFALQPETKDCFVNIRGVALVPGKKAELGETLWHSAATDTRKSTMQSAFSRLLESIGARISAFESWEQNKQPNAAPEDVWYSSEW